MGGKGKKREKSPDSYRDRFYRDAAEPEGLCSFRVRIKQTDLHILAARVMEEEARHLVIQYRHQLETYIAEHPVFLASLRPLPADHRAPAIVKSMLDAGQRAGVGPMAAVAGAVAEFVGRDLLQLGAGEVIVENGGDIFIARRSSCRIAIFAGTSSFSGRLAVQLRAGQMPVGVCTSSGTVGHSLSLGKADAVTVISSSASLADALATSIGNRIRTEADLSKAIEESKKVAGITGIILIRGEKIAIWGDIELSALPQNFLNR